MSHLSPTWILRSTVATFLTLLSGVALVALAAFLVATQAPDGVRDLRAYEACVWRLRRRVALAPTPGMIATLAAVARGYVVQKHASPDTAVS